MTPKPTDPVTAEDCRQTHSSTTRLLTAILVVMVIFPIGLVWSADRANRALEEVGRVRGDLKAIGATQEQANQHNAAALAEIKADLRALRLTDHPVHDP